jgi:hypothetical protein
VVSAFAELDVVQAWGDGTAVAADGMHVETYIDNLAVGADVGIPGLRPHRCRHTFGARSARAEPTPLRSRPSSGMPPSTQRPGTSAPDQPRTPPSLSVRSIADYPLTGPLPPSGFTWSGPQQVRVVRVAEYVGLVRGKEREHAARRDQGPGRRRGVGQLFSRL